MRALWACTGVFEALPHVQDMFPVIELARGDSRGAEGKLVAERWRAGWWNGHLSGPTSRGNNGY